MRSDSGPEPEPHFFLSRYAACARHAAFAPRAVASIRRLHPLAPITIVDDNSPPGFEFESRDPNTRVVANPSPRSGEMGALRVARESRGASVSPSTVVVVMHDSMVLKKAAGSAMLPEGEDLAFLWHFARYGLMHLPNSLRLLSRLTVRADVLPVLAHRFLVGFGTTWRGCFGMAVVARRCALERVHSATGVMGAEFLRHVACREDRQAAERIFALAAQAYARRVASHELIPSVCGDVFAHPSPWDPRSADKSLDELLRVAYSAPFLKTWSGR